MSPAVAVVGVVDITRAAVRIGAQTYEPLPPFLAALLIYALIVFALRAAPAGASVERRRAAGSSLDAACMIHEFGIVWASAALLSDGSRRTPC